MKFWLAIVLSAVIGFGVSYLLGFVLIPWLHKLKFGQTILDIGPSWHKKKQGTPTMGGFLFIAGTAVSLAVVLITDKLMGGDLLAFGTDKAPDEIRVKLFGGLLLAAGFGLIGFVDDYIKVVKKRNLGLTEIQKTVLQLVISAAYLYTLFRAGYYSIFVPYYGSLEGNSLGIKVLFWIIGFAALYCTSNAVNFLDGVDGLCSSVTAVACAAFAVCAVLRQFAGLSILACAVCGSLAGYLMWNWNPSKVMMGDVGSLFLGGIVCALAFGINCPWIILLIGIIYVAEFGSDILQVAYIKTHHGKKLFRMAPIHHHYELGGWSEKKICVVFSLVTVLGSAAGIALLWFGRPM